MYFNDNFNSLTENYLFAEIAERIKKYTTENPEKKVLKMGIGDVTLPLVPAVTEAMHKAVDEMSQASTFRGYGPYEGYSFLREAIKNYYGTFGVKLNADEIFVSDGAKSDLANVTEIFSQNNTVLIPDPVYPVYVDSNIIAGRKIIYIAATEENGFLPLPDKKIKADVIYICSPNNPTGAVYSQENLKEWVDYANASGAVILYDAAYERFISQTEASRSIFQIEGARTCAIEFCSFSKTAGFTGTRCGYTVIPNELERGGIRANSLWYRRQSVKFNGVPYVVQRGAEAVFSKDGKEQIQQNINYYRGNAEILANCLYKLGIWYTGGKNSPYIWLKCPEGMKSWQFFDKLLNEAQVAGTPGAGFGKNGEGYFRLTAFGSRETTTEAAKRIEKFLK